MMCPDKVPYATLRGAAEAARDMLSSHGPQRAYVCDRCDRYHLTTQPLGRVGNITAEQVLALCAALGGGR